MKKFLKSIDKLILFVLCFSILAFILYPFVKIFVSSFYVDNKFTLSGFKFLEKNSKLIYNSIISATYTTILTTIASTMIGLYYFWIKDSYKKAISVFLMLTMISPPFVSSLSYIKLFGRRGFITHDILGLSIDPYGLLGIVLMQSISLISISALVIISYLDKVDKSQINSALSLGAKHNNIMTDILLPTLVPSIKVISVLAFVRSISDFSTPLIIGGAFETLASRSYISFIAYGNIFEAGAMNVLLCIPALFVFIVYVRNSNINDNSAKGFVDIEIIYNKKGYIYYFCKVISLFFIVFLALQYTSIILSAFTDYYKGNIYFTLGHFKEIGLYIDKVFERSIRYSIMVAVMTTFIGFMLEYYIFVRKKGFVKIFDFISTLPYILPGTFFGIGYILAFNKAPIKITGTVAIVILNLIFKQLPFSTKIFNASMNFVEQNQIYSAKDLGANEFFVLKDVVAPKSLNSIFVSIINNFNATMTTVGSIIFLVYPSQKLLTLTMFDVINSGKYNIAAVIALLIIVSCLAFSGICFGILYLLNRGGKIVSKS